MAKQKKDESTTVVVAEAIGRALGMVAGTADALKAQHPHPIDEAMSALAEGQRKLADATTAAGEQVAVVGTTAMTEARKTRKTMARTPSRGSKTLARVTGRTKTVTKKVAKQAQKAAKKAVKRARTTTRNVVKRVKKSMGRARKATAKNAGRVRK